MERHMQNKHIQTHLLLKKIQTLPPERIAEIEDFIDFLCQRDYDRHLIKAASKISEKKLKEIWDNPEDDDYDKL